MKTFRIIIPVAIVLALAAVVLSIVGVVKTGFYPGVIVLLLVALIPIASKLYTKNIISKPDDFQKKYYTRLTIINVLSILVMLWMTFVIVHDRILQDCC
jgi:ABC-type transport system involved in cytochrome bd biosynthesis fused ATPase/permease subunit